jgi:hypothetical protein
MNDGRAEQLKKIADRYHLLSEVPNKNCIRLRWIHKKKTCRFPFTKHTAYV